MRFPGEELLADPIAGGEALLHLDRESLNRKPIG